MSILPSSGSAQSVRPPDLLRLGPLGLTPGLIFVSGFDSNVLNSDSEEQQDFVMDLRPMLDTALGSNRVRLTTSTTVTFAYFRDYPGQGGQGARHAAQLDYMGNRIRPFVAGTYLNSNERFSLEVDERARRQEYSARGGLDLRVASKVTVTTYAERGVYDFEDALDSQGRPLTNLNRRSDRGAATLSYSHSPFATIGVTAEARRDVFEAETRPEARSFRVQPSAEFRTAGLLSGRAEAGVLRFEPQVAGVAPFTGPVAAVNLSYVLRDRTMFTVRVGRDLNYSADAPLTYYIQDGISGSIGRAFGERWELRGTWEQQVLDYRNRESEEPAESDQATGRSRVVISRGQLEFRIRRDLRLSLVGEFSRRSASGSLRGFEKFRAYTALAYGL